MRRHEHEHEKRPMDMVVRWVVGGIGIFHHMWGESFHCGRSLRIPDLKVLYICGICNLHVTTHLTVKIDSVAQGSINTNIDTKRWLKTRGRLSITPNAISVK